VPADWRKANSPEDLPGISNSSAHKPDVFAMVAKTKSGALFTLQEKEMNRMNFGLLKQCMEQRGAFMNGRIRPPRGEGLEGRIAKLEKFMANSCDRLTRIETRLEQTATRTDLHQQINILTWRLVRFVCGFGTTLVVATYFVASHVK
jgi:hypothetical protein